MPPKHLRRFVNESASRLNEHIKNDADMMVAPAESMMGKRLTYAQLMAM